MIFTQALMSIVIHLIGSLSAHPFQNENVLGESVLLREETIAALDSRDSNYTDVTMYLYKRRVSLVGMMLELEKQMDAQLAIGNNEAGKNLTVLLDDNILPRIDEVAMAIFEHSKNDLNGELTFHQEIRLNVTRIHFKAGARQCENHDEAFNEATKRCEKLDYYQYGPFIGKEAVPTNQTAVCPVKERQIFIEVDPKRNIGKCVCRSLDVYGRELFVSFNDEQCHVENEKGFCGEGQWTVKEEGLLKCGAKPTDCPADGFHAYGTVRGITTEPKCHAINAQGPCEENKRVTRDIASGDLICVGEI